MTEVLRKPPWLRVKLPLGQGSARVRGLMRGSGLHTVCEEALCPNMGECWEKGHATVMILGDACTRNCRFCNVRTGAPMAVDAGEPARVAEAARDMGLRDVVLTSVTRDDLPDGGARAWAETIRALRRAVPGIGVEVLVPDFRGSADALDVVLAEKPDVFGHNLETVPSLYPRVRPKADYATSLSILARAHRRGLIVKTGIMLGLGEAEDEVLALMSDARATGCDILYIGQYLRPTWEHLPVVRYVEPAEFDRYGEAARKAGFGVVVSAPLVRSSYHSEAQARFVASRRGCTAPGEVEGKGHATPEVRVEQASKPAQARGGRRGSGRECAALEGRATPEVRVEQASKPAQV